MSGREIQLHLLRHAHAGDPMKWSGPDDVRPLSEKGRLQAERLGLLLADAAFEPDAILSSPKLRHWTPPASWRRHSACPYGWLRSW